jgi:ribonuclease Z
VAFTLTILGSSSALPTSDRYTSAHILNVYEHFFLIDCGEGTQIRLRQNKFRFSKINHIFISHLHGDHFFGIFGLLSSFNILGRKNTLHIYSFPELESIINNTININGLEFTFPIEYHHLQNTNPEIIYSDKNVEVSSFPLVHRIPTCGFLFKEKLKSLKIDKGSIAKYKIPVHKIPDIKKGLDFITEDGILIKNAEITLPNSPQSSYAYCSDTLYSPEIVPVIENVSLLYHESTFLSDLSDRAVTTFHSTANQAAQIAKAAHAGKLVLGHFSVRYKTLDEMLEEAKQVFENTELAVDGLQFSF